MKTVAKTMGKVVIEVTTEEIENTNFDIIWDKIREKYSSDDFNIFSINPTKTNSKIFVELVPAIKEIAA